MPNGHFEYSFNVPLLVKQVYRDTIEAGHLDGVAEIDYDASGSWAISDIYLDGWNTTTHKFGPKVPVPVDSQIYMILHDRLTRGKTAEFIQSDVRAELEDDRAYAEAAE